MTNESVRKELKELMQRLGIKQRFIAKKVELSDTTISYFIRDMRDLPVNKLQEIHEFCTQNNNS